MKKIVCAVLMFSAAAFAALGQDSNEGVISELSGDVELKYPGTDVFVFAQPGDTVTQDTIVSTGFKSVALIKIGSSVIVVHPLTRLSIAEIESAADEESVNIHLQTGRTMVEVKPPAGAKAHFVVHGPSISASVRGTSFDFDIQNVDVREGTVAVWSKYGPKVMVKDGQSGVIGANRNAEIRNEEILPLPPSEAAENKITTPVSNNTGRLSISVKDQ